VSTPQAAAKHPRGLGPRAQRRALAGGLGIFALGAAEFVFVFFGNTSKKIPETHSSTPATLAPKEPTVPLNRSLIALAKDFINTAVVRKNLAHAYDIVGPDIRGGMTRAQFEKGNIPVIEYPVDPASLTQLEYTVDYSHPTQAMIEVGLNPKAGSGTRRLTFWLGFKKVGKGKSAHWVVNYWIPRYKPPVPLAQ